MFLKNGKDFKVINLKTILTKTLTNHGTFMTLRTKSFWMSELLIIGLGNWLKKISTLLDSIFYNANII